MRAAVAALVLWGCAAPAADTSVPPPAVVDAGPALDGLELMAQYECARCHDGLEVAAVPLEKHCVRCHREILAGRFAAAPADLARWQRHLVSLPAAPSLRAAGTKLRRDWVRRYLLSPHDVRPALVATMPRLALGEAEAEALARALVPEEAAPVAFAPGEVEAGRALYDELRCNSCHDFTGAAGSRTPGPPASDALLLAPDLAFARERLQPAAVVAHLLDPRAVDRDTQMPSYELSEAAARALAAYVLTAPLAPRPPPAPPGRLPLLQRRVGWDEVAERVFRKVCWHCHGQPAYARGDGGPGNTGGFGFPPRGLDLSSATGAASGAFGDDGRRRSIFAPLDDGTPRLVMHLLARQREEAGESVTGIRGMPLGLPALSPEELQLVESWVAQGRPR